MPDQYFSPHQAALQLGISVHSVRRWCTEFAQHLSPSASPERGATRRLSEHDLEVLQEVKRLRDEEGLTVVQINERLQDLIIGRANVVEASHVAPASPQQATTALAVVEALQTALLPFETRLQALESQQPTWRDVFIIGLSALFVGVMIGLSIWWFQ